MKMANIRFDDPQKPGDPSRIFLTVMKDLELLDYARRYFERIGDSSCIRRAQEIRKFYKQIMRDYVYIFRSLIPEQIIDDHFKLHCERLEQIKDA